MSNTHPSSPRQRTSTIVRPKLSINILKDVLDFRSGVDFLMVKIEQFAVCQTFLHKFEAGDVFFNVGPLKEDIFLDTI